jgi:uncharacterized protein YndB with AHSA1/START domain
MAKPALDPTVTLTITRTFTAPRERVFKAWTDPQELKKWWAAGPGYTTPIAEVDLRVGGRYRLAMKPPDADAVYIVGGVYREVRPPERLVYTWAWEGSGAPETVVTVEFRDRGTHTEVILTHGAFADAAERDKHVHGWNGCLDHLTGLMEVKR